MGEFDVVVDNTRASACGLPSPLPWSLPRLNWVSRVTTSSTYGKNCSWMVHKYCWKSWAWGIEKSSTIQFVCFFLLLSLAFRGLLFFRLIFLFRLKVAFFTMIMDDISIWWTQYTNFNSPSHTYFPVLGSMPCLFSQAVAVFERNCFLNSLIAVAAGQGPYRRCHWHTLLSSEHFNNYLHLVRSTFPGSSPPQEQNTRRTIAYGVQELKDIES